MDLKYYREKIDLIDDEFIHLFISRMKLAGQIATYKKAYNLPIYDCEREQEVLRSAVEKAGPDFEEYVCKLYSLLFELSRNYQSKSL